MHFLKTFWVFRYAGSYSKINDQTLPVCTGETARIKSYPVTVTSLVSMELQGSLTLMTLKRSRRPIDESAWSLIRSLWQAYPLAKLPEVFFGDFDRSGHWQTACSLTRWLWQARLMTYLFEVLSNFLTTLTLDKTAGLKRWLWHMWPSTKWWLTHVAIDKSHGEYYQWFRQIWPLADKNAGSLVR